jgi:hypothetical protein
MGYIDAPCSGSGLNPYTRVAIRLIDSSHQGCGGDWLKTICSPDAVGGIAGIGTAGNSGGYDGSDSCVANELDRCDSASR